MYKLRRLSASEATPAGAVDRTPPMGLQLSPTAIRCVLGCLGVGDRAAFAQCATKHRSQIRHLHEAVRDSGGRNAQLERMGATNAFDLTVLCRAPRNDLLRSIADEHFIPTGVKLWTSLQPIGDSAPRIIDVAEIHLDEFLAKLLGSLVVLRDGICLRGPLESLTDRLSDRIRVLDLGASGITGDVSALANRRLGELDLRCCQSLTGERMRRGWRSRGPLRPFASLFLVHPPDRARRYSSVWQHATQEDRP